MATDAASGYFLFNLGRLTDLYISFRCVSFLILSGFQLVEQNLFSPVSITRYIYPEYKEADYAIMTLIAKKFKGRQVLYVQQGDENRAWFSEFRSKAASTLIPLSTVDVCRYDAVFIPASHGAIHDLSNDSDLSQILEHFIVNKKPVCAVGMGVAGLFSACMESEQFWLLKKYSLTSPSVYDLAFQPRFASLPIVPEDFIKQHGGQYSYNTTNHIHVVIDDHLITGQNEASTTMAVHNLSFLCTQG